MALTDYLRASDGNGESVRCIVVDPRGIGDTAFNNTTPTNWPNTFVAMVGTVNTTTDRFNDGYLVFKGHLEGSVIRIDEFAPGYTDTGSPANDTIVIKPTTLWADIVADVAEQAASDAADALAGVTGKLDEDFTLLTPKTTPVDADLLPIADSAASYATKKLTFANLWAWVAAKILANPSNTFLAAHPVGSIYMSITSTNPGSTFGGTWTAWGTGRMPIGVDSGNTSIDAAEETGGTFDHRHGAGLEGASGTETYGSGTGDMRAAVGASSSDASRISYKAVSASMPNGGTRPNTTYGIGGTGYGPTSSWNHFTPVYGYTNANNPPYIAVYMWKRTA